MQLRSTGLTWQVVDDEVVVLDLEGSVYLQLNGSGRLLWERLATGASEDELAETLIETYDVEAAQAAADVAGFVQALHDKNLIDG